MSVKIGGLSLRPEDAATKAFIHSALNAELEKDFVIPTKEEVGDFWYDVVRKIAVMYRIEATADDENFFDKKIASKAVKSYVDAIKETDDGQSLRLILDSVDDDDTALDNIVSIPKLWESAAINEELAMNSMGWIHEYVAYSKHWVPFGYDGYHYTSAVMILAILAARRIYVDDIGLEEFTSIYSIFVGETTTGKSAVAENALFVIKKLGLLDVLLSQSKMTSNAIIKLASSTVSDETNTDNMTQVQYDNFLASKAYAGKISWFFDEFGQHLNSILTPTSYLASLRSLLLQWENSRLADGQGSITSGHDTVDDVYLCLLGCATISNFTDLPKNAKPYDDGLIARCLLVCPPISRSKYMQRPRGTRTIPSNVLVPLHGFLERLGYPNVGLERVPTRGGDFKQTVVHLTPYPQNAIQLSDKARELYENYAEFLWEIRGIPEGEEDSIPREIQPNYGRLATKVLRVAALIAFINGNDIINASHIEAAKWLSEMFWRPSLHEFHSQVFKGSATQSRKEEDDLYKYIVMNSRAGKWVSVAQIHSKVNLDTKRIGDICNTLCDQGQLEVVEKDMPHSLTGKKLRKYALPGTPLPISAPRKKKDEELVIAE